MLLPVIVLVSLCLFQNVNCQFGDNKQSYGFVDTREGAHMFYWLYYTTAAVPNYTQRPLVVWLQGGPGGSSTGIGNFEILGPLDLSLQPRNYTWVNDFNVLFLDNPVGTGFSYVDDFSYLTTDNEQIADDFVAFMRGFYLKHPEFEGVPLYIYGQSYGGKMAVDMAIKMKEAEAASTINSNLRGIAMGNAWIHPVDLTLTWGPLLLAAGLVDQAGHDAIQDQARMAETLFNEGRFEESTAQWARTQSEVFARTGNVDFYNILTKMPGRRLGRDARSDIALTRDMLITSRHYGASRQEWDLYELMNTRVKAALGVPAGVVWDGQSNAVFNYLRGDFMKPVTDGIEKLLNETDIIVMKYNGNLDLICDTPGQLLWVDRLQWSGAEQFSLARREPLWEDGRLEGYSQSYGNFRFFYINVAGHSSSNTLYGISNVKKPLIRWKQYHRPSGQLLWVDRLRWSGAEQFSLARREPLWEDGRLEGYSQSYGNFRFFYINVAGHSALWSAAVGSRLQWAGAGQFSRARREPLWEDGRLEGHSQSHGNFRFFYINVAGHSVPRDNPQGTKAFLRDMTSFG